MQSSYDSRCVFIIFSQWFSVVWEIYPPHWEEECDEIHPSVFCTSGPSATLPHSSPSAIVLNVFQQDRESGGTECSPPNEVEKPVRPTFFWLRMQSGISRRQPEN